MCFLSFLPSEVSLMGPVCPLGGACPREKHMAHSDAPTMTAQGGDHDHSGHVITGCSGAPLSFLGQGHAIGQLLPDPHAHSPPPPPQPPRVPGSSLYRALCSGRQYDSWSKGRCRKTKLYFSEPGPALFSPQSIYVAHLLISETFHFRTFSVE